MAIETTEDGPIRTLRMARPEKKNALTGAMYAALVEGLRAAAADASVRVGLIAGGADFCAGNGIADFAQVGDAAGDGPSPAFAFLEALVAFPKPLVMAVRGNAVGIGTTMLLHADAVVVGEAARLMLPFARLGVVPEGGSSLLLARRVGEARARWWLLSGEAFSGAEAAAAGLAMRAAPDAEVEEAALAMARQLAALPPGAAAESKRLLLAPHAEALKAAMEAERESFSARLRTEEAQAAFAAFLSRR
jgi:enoyl-CoA hydratase/carnithine racemase